MEENEFRILFYFFLPLRRNFSIISRSDPFQFILSALQTVRYFSFFSFFRVSRNENRRFEKIKMLEFLFSREIRERDRVCSSPRFFVFNESSFERIFFFLELIKFRKMYVRDFLEIEETKMFE